MWSLDVLYLTVVLTLGFGLSALITSMFEMMRTGFILTVHVVLQMLAFLAILLTWVLFVLNPTLVTSLELVQYGAWATLILAVLAFLVWLGNMFRGLMLFRCMQGSSFHSHVFAFQLLFIFLSLTTIGAL